MESSYLSIFLFIETFHVRNCLTYFCKLWYTSLQYNFEVDFYFDCFWPNSISHLTFMYPCIASIIVNDHQQYATILAYLFTPNQLYMFWALSSPIIRST